MTNAIKTTKITFKKTESEWYNYHHTLKEIARLREEIMNPFDEEINDPTVFAGASSVRTPGDPTERMATRLMTSRQLDYLNGIVTAIEQVYNASPDNYKKLIRVRYWNNRKLDWDAIADEIPVHKVTAMRWRNDIVQATIEVLGWR